MELGRSRNGPLCERLLPHRRVTSRRPARPKGGPFSSQIGVCFFGACVQAALSAFQNCVAGLFGRRIPLNRYLHLVFGRRGTRERSSAFWTLSLSFGRELNVPFDFGWSTRSSRNSSGPLIKRRFRLNLTSSSGVSPVNLSITFDASSFARSARSCFGVVLTVNPNSTRRRMASERRGLSFCLAVQTTTSARTAGANLTAVTGDMPPFFFGRPMRPFLFTEIDRFMISLSNVSQCRDLTTRFGHMGAYIANIPTRIAPRCGGSSSLADSG